MPAHDHIPKINTAWFTYEFNQFFERMHNLGLILNLNITSIHVARTQFSSSLQSKQIEHALAPNDSFEQKQIKQQIESIEDTIKFIDTQSKNGFSELFGQTLVSLWGALDVLIHDLGVALVDHDPRLLQGEVANKLTIKFSEYISLPKEDIADRVITDLEQYLKSDIKSGVGGFEAMLSAFNLGGGLADAHKRTLFEVSQIRNVIVHKGSIADKRFCNQCPWLEKKPGDRLFVTAANYDAYLRSIRTYVEQVQDRFVRKFVINKVS